MLKRLPSLPQLDPRWPAPGPGEMPTYLPPWLAPPPAPRRGGRPRKDGTVAPPFVVEEGPDGYRDVSLPLAKGPAQAQALTALMSTTLGAIIGCLPFWCARAGNEGGSASRRQPGGEEHPLSLCQHC